MIGEAGEEPLRDGELVVGVVIDGRREVATCTVRDAATRIDCEGLPGILDTPLHGQPDAPHRILELTFDDDAPTRIGVTVDADGRSLLDESAEPGYEAGDYCDTECRFASLAFELAE
ncbi:MAG: hypothetical protein IAG13_09780 [Deltaproteobacteria bacterium]|nr:hypothetical protein [Nannocystaceae bacterium]